jgi:HK97 family phage major capsid protein
MSSHAVTSAIRRAQALAHEIKAERRDATPTELALLEQAAELAERVVIDERIKSFGEAIGPAQNQVGAAWNESGDPGSKFIASEGYKRIRTAEGRGQQWTSGAVDVGPVGYKATMVEGVGGTLVPPHYTGGIVEQNFTPLGLAEYFSQQQTTSNSVRYSLEGTATNAAAGVAEGAAKPESALALQEVEERVRKLATVVHISEELLEDAPAVQSYINNRLTRFVKLVEEAQILRGGGGNDLSGIVGRSGVNTLNLGTATPHITIFKAAAGIRGSAFVDPDLVVLHPTTWQVARLLTDSTGQFLGGGPWQGQYGQQSQINSGYFSSAPLWNMNVWVTPTIGAGTALVGSAREAARIYRRGGLTVESSNSHASHFVENKVAVRAEERLALAVFRPSAWCVVSGLP